MALEIDKIVPDVVTLPNTLIFVMVFSLAVLLITLFAKLILGKNSSLKHALVSSLGILVMYGLYVVIYTFDPAGLSRYTAPLPYVFFVESEVTIFNFAAHTFPEICMQVLSMLLLSYLVNQINSFTPPNLKPLGWLLYRFCCAGVAIFAHYLAYRVVTKLVTEFLPGPVVEFAPMILLGIVVFMFLLAVIKFLVGLFLTVVNPLFGGLYTFFFVNKIGKNISRAIGTTIVLTIFTIVLYQMGCGSLIIAPDKLDSYIPFCVCIVILWVIIGHKL